MRFGKRADHDVAADGTAACGMCGERVPIDIGGHCELGHRVLSPEAAEQALAGLDGAEALTGDESGGLEAGPSDAEAMPAAEPEAMPAAGPEAMPDAGPEAMPDADPGGGEEAYPAAGADVAVDRGEEPSDRPQPGLDIENLLRDSAHLN